MGVGLEVGAVSVVCGTAISVMPLCLDIIFMYFCIERIKSVCGQEWHSTRLAG